MSEVRWIKIGIQMHDDEKIRLIDALDNRDTVHYVWVRLLIQAGKTNAKGMIFLNQGMPYTNEMLSIIFNRPIEAIESALKILEEFKMIKIDEENYITILNWEKHQNIEGMEKLKEQNRKRAERFRAKNRAEDNIIAKESDTTSTTTDGIEEDYDIDNENHIKPLRDENNKMKNSKTVDDLGYDIKIQDDKNSEVIDDLNHENSDTAENFYHKNNNVTVTQQNKRENKNKNKSKRETQKEKGSDVVSEIREYIKRTSGKLIKVSISAVKSAVSVHGEANVKLAIDKAVEVNKVRFNYINGILRNWQLEGYPGNYGDPGNNGIMYKKEHKKLAFNNFEPRKYDYDALEKALLGWE